MLWFNVSGGETPGQNIPWTPSMRSLNDSNGSAQVLVVEGQLQNPTCSFHQNMVLADSRSKRGGKNSDYLGIATRMRVERESQIIQSFLAKSIFVLK